MDLRKLSSKYEVRALEDRDVDLIYQISIGNPVFYKYCPPFVTKESIRNDMSALPPNKSKEDKFYIGFFRQEELIAILDLIVKYPDDETAYIGLYMMNREYQGKGIGSELLEGCAVYLKNAGFRYMQLAYAKGNMQSESFWVKNGFVKTGQETVQEGYTAVSMQREL